MEDNGFKEIKTRAVWFYCHSITWYSVVFYKYLNYKDFVFFFLVQAVQS